MRARGVLAMYSDQGICAAPLDVVAGHVGRHRANSGPRFPSDGSM
jgi:hypothetical protein